MAAVCTLAAGSQPQVNMLLLLAPGYLRPMGLGEYIWTHHETGWLWDDLVPSDKGTVICAGCLQAAGSVR